MQMLSIVKNAMFQTDEQKPSLCATAVKQTRLHELSWRSAKPCIIP